MTQLLISAFFLSVVHAAIPNHWLAIVAIAKGEKWSRSLTLRVTFITGIAHITSTIIIGLLVGWAGYEFSGRYNLIFKLLAPSLLCGLGLIFLFIHFTQYSGNRPHSHHDEQKINRVSVPAIITSLSIAMFFSPCIELEAYYFTAGSEGWAGILSVSFIYLIVTVATMLLLVSFAIKGFEKININFLKHNERLIIGIILILTGLVTFLT